jgi:hypothetical protein
MPSGRLKPCHPGQQSGRSARRVARVGVQGGRSTYGRVSVDASCDLGSSRATSFRDGSAGRGAFAPGSGGILTGRNAGERVVGTNVRVSAVSVNWRLL